MLCCERKLNSNKQKSSAGAPWTWYVVALPTRQWRTAQPRSNTRLRIGWNSFHIQALYCPVLRTVATNSAASPPFTHKPAEATTTLLLKTHNLWWWRQTSAGSCRRSEPFRQCNCAGLGRVGCCTISYRLEAAVQIRWWPLGWRFMHCSPVVPAACCLQEVQKSTLIVGMDMHQDTTI